MKSHKVTSLKHELESLKDEGLYRSFRPMEGPQDSHIKYDGREFLNLSSNNSLGMANHPDVIKAAQDSLTQWGMGSGGARLLGGTHLPHVALEKKLASLHKSDKALVFNSGYTANASVIQTMAGFFDHLLSDKLNHASIIDGILNSRISYTRYRHLDMNHLEELLKKQASPEKTMVISETLFSMEGDFAPLEDLLSLQKTYSFFLYLDEAHSFACYPGLLHQVCENGFERTAVMGTMGKAVGCYGAFIAGAEECIEYLINKARGFIFSTSLPPGITAAAAASLDIIQKENWRIEKLHEISSRARVIFSERGLNTGNSRSHIIPLIVGENRKAVEASNLLLQNGIYALPVRPPTVPRGSARVRLSLHGDVTEDQLINIAEMVSG